MPFRTIPESNTRYGLLSFDRNGQERGDDPDGVMSERLLEIAATGNATNIFLFCHGWMGDVPAAIRQYDRWIKEFDTLSEDRERAAAAFPGFSPLYIGLHWPSLPWGDEELGGGSFAARETPGPEELFSAYLERFGDTAAIRDALHTIIDDARGSAGADQIPAQARAAFTVLDSELGLSAGPDTDGLPIDPDRMFEEGQAASFGGAGGGVLDMLRTFSYWSMKRRGRSIGEGAMHRFATRLQAATTAHIHLMGHSFGCVVISSILCGPEPPLDRPVDSVALVQGAVSLWAFAARIPYGGGPGYFHQAVAGKVSGPLIATRSRHDLAVNQPYRLASQASGAVSFEVSPYPKYGAIGRFGIQGLAEDLSIDSSMRSASEEYGFECGRVYNLEASEFICKMEGASGAHNDISGAEVAHAIWEAALAGDRG